MIVPPDISLRDYFDMRLADALRTLDERQRALDERQMANDVRFAAQQQALIVARAELERRLEGMNEFRAQLQNQAAQFVGRDMFDARLAEVHAKREGQAGDVASQFSAVESRLNVLDSGLSKMTGYIAGAAGLMIVIEFALRFWKG